jgi:hypothetical protein
VSIAEQLAKGVAAVAKEHYREKKATERRYRSNYRPWKAAPRESLKDAVFAVMPEAIANASGGSGLPFSVRQLFYKIRPLLDHGRELTYSYFTPPLVTEYEETYGDIPGLLYDARGNLREPHNGQTVPLGTADVSRYSIPEWTFDKVLYIEKEGFTRIFEASRLGERYDLAIMAGKGYATRAAKELLAAAEAKEITILVLHDADFYGEEIARTLAEETRTSPYSIDIIDIGLSAADVATLGLPTERDRHGRLRTEINALGSQQLIDFIEAKLEENGLTEKVVPPEDVAKAEFEKKRDEELKDAASELVSAALEQAFGLTLDSLNAQAGELLAADLEPPDDFHTEMIRVLNDEEREKSWRAHMQEVTEQAVEQRMEESREEIVKKLTGRLQQSDDDGGVA